MALNSLLKYRFTKKPVPKLNHSDEEDSPPSDSQSTVIGDTQSQSGDSQATVDPNVIAESPLSQNGFGFYDDDDSLPSLSTTTSPQTNGTAKIGGKITNTSDGNSKTAGANMEWKSKLKEMFPNSPENRINAALIVHSADFDKAVEFIRADPNKKRPLEQNGSEVSPENRTKNYKRIKMMSESPDTPKVVGIEMLGKSNQDQSCRKSLEFLQGCFPAKNVQDLEAALTANNGDANQTVAQFTSQGATVAVVNGISGADVAGPSTTIGNSKKHSSRSKKVKRKEVYLSDESEDEYDDSMDSDDSEDLNDRSKSETDVFLEFFEEATIEELNVVPGCSKKKAEIIMAQRPFKTWETLYEKFNTIQGLTTTLISGCKEVMQVRNTVRRLMVRCENISSQMEMVVSKLTDGQDNRYKIAKQPATLNQEFNLKPYQLIGLSWLRVMHEQELNGILADEMGLGKTIQAIAFLAHLKMQGEEGPHVVIVPASTIENWLRELQLWCPSLKVIVYYGSQDDRRAVRHSIFFQGEEFNVLLTTYTMATGAAEDRVLFKKFEFHYAIFDEGHMLKNMSSLRFQNLMKISADRRLLLTGTPLQNNLLELMSLLCFVMPEMFQGKTDHLKKVFAMISRSGDKKSRFERDRINHAKRIMKPFVLRRLKRDVLAQLPPKNERIERCSMIPIQQELYDGLLSKYMTISDDDDAEKSGGGVGIFMQFRKAANHPLLLRNRYTDSILQKMAVKIAKEPSHRDRGALPALIQEDMGVMSDFELMALCKQYKKYAGEFLLDQSVILESGKFKVLDRLLPEMKERGDRVLLFSQFTIMLDVMEPYMEQRGYKYLRLDGATPVPDRLQLIDKFNNDPDIFVFLLSTRAGGLGINLTAANTIILHDIDFNPYNDKQAEDRCHRLGQKREVNVVRLICEDTVDEVILRCANSKLMLEKDLTESNADDEEESKKDVANLLKEVIKTAQHKKEATLSAGDVTAQGISNGTAS